MIQAFDDSIARTVVDAPEEDQRWLSGFLSPAYRTLRADDADRRFLALDPAESLEVPRGAARLRVVYAMDSEAVRLPSHEGEGRWSIADPVLNVQYHVEGSRTTIRFEHWNRTGARLASMRVIREHSHNAALASGRVILHAAAFTAEGQAVAIAGSKGSGKTTLLLRLLASGRARYLCNDRLAVDPATGRARAVPTIVAIRDGTRRLASELAAALQRAGDFRLNEVERRAGTSLPSPRGDVWHFSPAQVAAAAGCEMDAEAPLTAVLVIAGKGERTTLTPIPAADASRVLAEHTIGARNACYTSEVFSPPATPVDAGQIRRRCEQLARRITVFAIHAGEWQGPDETAALIGSIVS